MTAAPRYEAEVLRMWQGQSDGAHDLWHLRRVWALCQRFVAELKGGDLAILEAAAFLHDVVNLPKDDPNRPQAAALSADHAVAFLRADGFAEGKLAAVAHAIEAHSFSAGKSADSLEAQILQDADRLDALGAIGIARCFNVSGQMGGGLFDGADPLAQHRSLDDRKNALDHFEIKLFPIAQSLNTAPARRLARERVEFMKMFRKQLVEDATGSF